MGSASQCHTEVGLGQFWGDGKGRVGLSLDIAGSASDLLGRVEYKRAVLVYVLGEARQGSHLESRHTLEVCHRLSVLVRGSPSSCEKGR